MILRFRLLSVFLVALVGLVMLSACGDNTNTSSSTLTTASATTAASSAAAAAGTTMSATSATATPASSTVATTSLASTTASSTVAATTASSTMAATTVVVVTTPVSTTSVAATTLSATTAAGSTTAAGAASSDVAAGKQVFSLNCSRCHAQNGTAAGQGPKLAGNRGAGDANNVTRTVRNGARGMPAFTTSQVSDSDLTKIIAYLKTLQ